MRLVAREGFGPKLPEYPKVRFVSCVSCPHNAASRRPWSFEDIDAAFVVKDGNYVYYEEEPGRRSAAKLLTKDEARRIAANIA